MTPTTESYPFSEPPGKEINRGYTSIVRELGPDWVIKEFNPTKPDGTTKDEESIERSRDPNHIKELQETQRILSQDFIYGNKLIPTHWVLGKDENGREKFWTVQKRFKGETLRALRDQEKFTEFFNENRDLKEQMLELMWGTKRALVETGFYPDFHVGNITVVHEKANDYKLKLFDVPDMFVALKLLYGEPPAPVTSRKFVLANFAKRSNRLAEYEKWLDVTEEEKIALDKRFGIENGKYLDSVKKLLQRRVQLG